MNGSRLGDWMSRILGKGAWTGWRSIFPRLPAGEMLTEAFRLWLLVLVLLPLGMSAALVWAHEEAPNTFCREVPVNVGETEYMTWCRSMGYFEPQTFCTTVYYLSHVQGQTTTICEEYEHQHVTLGMGCGNVESETGGQRVRLQIRDALISVGSTRPEVARSLASPVVWVRPRMTTGQRAWFASMASRRYRAHVGQIPAMGCPAQRTPNAYLGPACVRPGSRTRTGTVSAPQNALRGTMIRMGTDCAPGCVLMGKSTRSPR